MEGEKIAEHEHVAAERALYVSVGGLHGFLRQGIKIGPAQHFFECHRKNPVSGLGRLCNFASAGQARQPCGTP